jgi:hypothetical protein
MCSSDYGSRLDLSSVFRGFSMFFWAMADKRSHALALISSVDSSDERIKNDKKQRRNWNENV